MELATLQKCADALEMLNNLSTLKSSAISTNGWNIGRTTVDYSYTEVALNAMRDKAYAVLDEAGIIYEKKW